MKKKVYGDDCLSRSSIHEWFKLFQEGREALEDDERSGRPRNVVNEENAEIVGEFIRKESKSQVKEDNLPPHWGLNPRTSICEANALPLTPQRTVFS